MSLQQFSIIDSTLREGEQSQDVDFTIEQSLEIAKLLDGFGVESIEVSSPCISIQNFERINQLLSLKLSTKIATHIRCVENDIITTLKTGIKTIHIYFNLNFYNQKFSGNRDLKKLSGYIENNLKLIKDFDSLIEVRFSVERTFEQDRKLLKAVFRPLIEKKLISRIGISDTLGVALPNQVESIVRFFRSFYRGPLEMHFHNDTDCAVINSFTALSNGATHIQTSVLGLGERNGITSFCGFIARIYSIDPEILTGKYDLSQLKKIVAKVSEYSGHSIPKNHFITGEKAFSHKAAPHIYSMISGLQDYEPFNPVEFEVSRNINIFHQMTSWKVIKMITKSLGMQMNDFEIKALTENLKKQYNSPIDSA